MTEVRVFDRVEDVSKLMGCNTRNVEYRWSIFRKYLDSVSPGSNVLDFGAGSLRDSHELAVLGYNVTSVDMDEALLSSYRADYNWPSNGMTHRIVGGSDPAESLAKISGDKFSLVTCFDVLEHLDNPTPILELLGSHMAADGKMFITVPNGRTLFELAFRADLLIARATKRRLQPGEAHLQLNSPSQWRRLIEGAGLKVLAHDMQIGAVVNTSFALVQLPVLLLCRVLNRLGIRFDGAAISSRICNPKLMSALDRFDKVSKPALRNMYGWNLFVVSRRDSAD
jgi:2-polyprenyl-3-methyl-5-hydroxy-6-metoxy-1,4-benzoquinol methylase